MARAICTDYFCFLLFLVNMGSYFLVIAASSYYVAFFYPSLNYGINTYNWDGWLRRRRRLWIIAGKEAH
jgi:hypothetical protein